MREYNNLNYSAFLLHSINFKRLAALLTLTLTLCACTNKSTQPPQAQASSLPQPVQPIQTKAQAQTTPVSNFSQPQSASITSPNQGIHPPLEQVFWKACGVNVFHKNTLEEYHETGTSGYWAIGCENNLQPLVAWGPVREAKMMENSVNLGRNTTSYTLYINSRGCMPYFNRPQPQRYYQAVLASVGGLPDLVGGKNAKALPTVTMTHRPISEQELKSLAPSLSAYPPCPAISNIGT